VRGLIQLLRLRLAAAVGLSAAAGYALADDGVGAELIPPAAGCILLAAGASALNQVQERRQDARMARTAGRPIPIGRLSALEGSVVAGMLLMAGEALLLLGSLFAAALGVLAVLWYNVLYTHLKRRTAFAAVPGALTGCLGPAIGWSAAGGQADGSRLFAIMIIMFLWQVPHFWVLGLQRKDEYRAAGLPSPAAALGTDRLSRITFVWSLGTAVATLMLPLLGVLQRPGMLIALGVAAAALAILGGGLLRTGGPSPRALRRGFAGLNLFILITLVLVLVDRGLAS